MATRLKQMLVAREPLHVLFLNDVGFQYGAGIAMLRQIQSFLLCGFKVELLCWDPGSGPEHEIPFVPDEATGTWLGCVSFPLLNEMYGFSPEAISNILLLEISQRKPDVVIVGNLHSARWPLTLLGSIQKELSCQVVVYMHDCYFTTGRCIYPGNCLLYQTGCDERCPTADLYPALAPDRIFEAWNLRKSLFSGLEGIPLVTNSNWMTSFARRAFPDSRSVDCLYCGLDTRLFSPINRSDARQLLDLPQEAFIILGGAINLEEYRKGGHLFQQLCRHYVEHQEIKFLAFGVDPVQPDPIPILRTGYLRDYRKMPLVFSAADLFVGTSLEEAFGQTFCEAQACAVPAVAFSVGGVPEVARHGVGARLSSDCSVEGLIREVDFLRLDAQVRNQYGSSGRKMVEQEFSLQAQAVRWLDYLATL